MKKRSLDRHHHSIGVVVMVFVAIMLVLVAVSYFNPRILFNNLVISNQDSANQQKDMMYESDLLDISFMVPEGFKIEDRLGKITLVGENGDIIVGRSGTNYENLDLYLQDYVSRNNLQSTKIENITINGLSAARLYSEALGFYYKIYYNNSAYSLQATSPDLYDELDQVAQSFRYLGDTSTEN